MRATVSSLFLCVNTCRGYAIKDENLAFWPTPVGEALISGYV